MRLAHVAGPPAPLARLGRRANGSGRVVLAAVVHQDSLRSQLETGCGPAAPEPASQREQQVDLIEQQSERPVRPEADGHASGQQPDEANQTGRSSNTGSRARKFGWLFASRRPSRRAGRRDATLIDSSSVHGRPAAGGTGSRPAPAHRHQRAASLAPANGRQQSAGGVEGHRPAPATTSPLQLAPPSGEQLDAALRPRRRDQVIEFKFDLIVEGEGEGEPAAGLGGAVGQKQQPGDWRPGGPAAAGSAQRKLVDNVNELVEAFVLDSNDVCLMSMGRRRIGRPPGDRHQFDYVHQLAELTLAYAFELLQATRAAAGQQLAAPPEGADMRPKADEYSLELGATLFIQRGAHLAAAGAPAPPTPGAATCAPMGFEIVDLLAAEGAACPPGATSSLECRTIQEALRCLADVMATLGQLGEPDARAHEHKNLLMISVKLKQTINGGLFNNRMCLIHLDPDLNELNCIFETIFDGQALAHLKRRKVHLKQLELELNRRIGSSCCLDELEKQHHHVASLNKLVQAEWLLYKQLSSALVRTLIIVHVHKLTLDADEPGELASGGAPLGGDGGGGSAGLRPDRLAASQLEVERQFMEHNLALLEFARSIQRASASRLRRRKRHLKSHHLGSSNLSVASNESASSADSAPVHELAMSPLREGARRRQLAPGCARRCSQRDISTGADLAPGVWPLARRGSLADECLFGWASLQRQHWPAASHRRHQGRLVRCHCARRLHRPEQAEGRLERLGQRRQRRAAGCACGRGPDVGESSSVSTSSGASQQRSSAGSSTLPAHANRLAGANLSDTDSATSANLNSCSSSPFNNASARYLGAGEGQPDVELQELAPGGRWAPGARLRREPELRWMTRQSGRLVAAARRRQCPASPLELVSSCNRTGQLAAGARNRSASSSRFELAPGAAEPPNRSVFQIDCPPALAVGQPARPICQQQQQQDTDQEDRLTIEDNTDNVSDICSVVAEPPRQLKLEQFLNQLSSIIAPVASANTSGLHEAGTAPSGGKVDNLSPTDGPRPPMEPNEAGDCGRSAAPGLPSLAPDRSGQDEDDEDCKSHSSILDHLSSLAFESSSRIRQQQLQRQPPPCAKSHLASDTTTNLHHHQDTRGTEVATGHLQRILNCTTRLRNTNKLLADELAGARPAPAGAHGVEERLRALSIDCGQQSTSPTCSGASTATFASSSIDSSCSSSSAVSSDLSNESGARRASARAAPPGASHLYASVIRPPNCQNVRT